MSRIYNEHNAFDLGLHVLSQDQQKFWTSAVRDGLEGNVYKIISQVGNAWKLQP